MINEALCFGKEIVMKHDVLNLNVATCGNVTTMGHGIVTKL